MTQLTPDFSDFLRLLNDHGVEYLVVGGYAVGHYGYPRATADLDIWVSTAAGNAARLLEVMGAFGFAGEDLDAGLFTEPDRVVRMGVPPVRIELLTGVDGVEFRDCWSRRVDAEWDGTPLHLIALADLKRNKRAAGRHKDLDDLEHLP
jgi:hypothetical protein